jgi:hypothetical protein
MVEFGEIGKKSNDPKLARQGGGFTTAWDKKKGPTTNHLKWRPIYVFGAASYYNLGMVLALSLLSTTNAQDSEPSCEDDPNFDGGYGGCDTYYPDHSAGNHAWCGPDGATVTCPIACGICVPTAEWQIADTNHTGCNTWQLSANYEGWGDAHMRIEADDGSVQVDNFVYEDNAFVSAGVSSGLCLHPSRCYKIIVTDLVGTAQWSLHDETGIVVVQGTGPFSDFVCHCGHNGGAACHNCTGVTPPPGGTAGTCS